MADFLDSYVNSLWDQRQREEWERQMEEIMRSNLSSTQQTSPAAGIGGGYPMSPIGSQPAPVMTQPQGTTPLQQWGQGLMGGSTAGGSAVSGGGAAAGGEAAAGGKCCFIFIEAHGGKLDPMVREFRDKLMTARNRRGYYRLADWLVPWMKRSRTVAGLVRHGMVNPMMKSGRWHKDHVGFPVMAHACGFFWLTVYNLLGTVRPYRRRSGEIV